jgi:hypothetical protein
VSGRALPFLTPSSYLSPCAAASNIDDTVLCGRGAVPHSTDRKVRNYAGASSGPREAYCSGLIQRLSRPSRMSDAQLKTLRSAMMRRYRLTGRAGT